MDLYPRLGVVCQLVAIGGYEPACDAPPCHRGIGIPQGTLLSFYIKQYVYIKVKFIFKHCVLILIFIYSKIKIFNFEIFAPNNNEHGAR